MSSDFVKRVGSFLDLEAHGEGSAEYALDMAYEFLQEKAPGLLKADTDNILIGEEASLVFLKTRAFPDARIEETRDQLDPRFEKETEGKLDPNGDLSVMVAGFELIEEEMDRLIEYLAAKDGISVADMKKAMETKAEERRCEELRLPALHRALLRRFLRNLDQMVERVEALEVLPLRWEKVPIHLQILVSNAHESSFLGQEVATAVLCGAVLEEALRVRLGQDQFKELGAGIKRAAEIGLLSDPSPALRAAREIQARRNEAIHDPKRYLAKPHMAKEAILFSARYVLATLFERTE